ERRRSEDEPERRRSAAKAVERAARRLAGRALGIRAAGAAGTNLVHHLGFPRVERNTGCDGASRRRWWARVDRSAEDGASGSEPPLEERLDGAPHLGDL